MKCVILYPAKMLVVLLFPLHFGEARLTTPKDVSLKTELEHVKYEVKSDGSYKVSVHTKKKALKEPGVERLSVFFIRYNANSETASLIEAKSSTNNKISLIDPKHVEDKPLASSVLGFDTINQILGRFSSLEIGSVIEYQFTKHVHTPSFKNFFSFSLDLTSSYIQSGIWEIKSELPLFIEVKDPKRFFKIRSWKKGSHYFVKIRLRRSGLFGVIEENWVSLKSLQDLAPRLIVSSSKNWKDMVKFVLDRYEGAAGSPIPPLYQKIVNKGKTKDSGVEQLNFITSQVSEHLRYFGDWRPINGGLVPRPLSEIAGSGFGDCKDMSVMVSAMLRALGYKARPALVLRGEDSVPPWSPFPDNSAFNHAIVWVQDKEGGEYWLDPTNPTSFANGIPLDIADRPALILDGENTRIRRTPKPASSQSETDLRFHYQIHPGRYKVKADAVFKGTAALPFTGMELVKSKKNLDYYIVSHFGFIDKMFSWKLGKYNLKTREVKDVKFNLQYILKNVDVRTTVGPGFVFYLGGFVDFLSVHSAILSKLKNRLTGIDLGWPKNIFVSISLQDVDPVGSLKEMACDIASPWMSYKRNIFTTEQPEKKVTIRHQLKILQRSIPVKSLKTPFFTSFQKEMDDCLRNQILIYKLNQKKLM